MWIGPICLQSVDGPHSQIADQEEGHNLPAWFAFHLFCTIGKSREKTKLIRMTCTVTKDFEHIPAWRIQNKDCLESGLGECCQWCQEGCEVIAQLEERSDDAECRVDEDPGLSHHQKQVVQFQLGGGVIPQDSNLEEANELAWTSRSWLKIFKLSIALAN